MKDKHILIEFDYDRYAEKHINTNPCLLFGRKGDQYLEPGYVYAPYVPLFIMGIDPTDEFNPSVTILSRYSKKIVNGNFYGKIIF